MLEYGLKKLLANGFLIPWGSNFVFNYYTTKSKKQQKQGGKNNAAFNICIIYYMGIYSGTNHQIVVSTLTLSANGALNYSLDCSRHFPGKILKYVTWKGKLPASTLGEEAAFL